jgi:hypothetical protein
MHNGYMRRLTPITRRGKYTPGPVWQGRDRSVPRTPLYPMGDTKQRL